MVYALMISPTVGSTVAPVVSHGDGTARSTPPSMPSAAAPYLGAAKRDSNTVDHGGGPIFR